MFSFSKSIKGAEDDSTEEDAVALWMLDASFFFISLDLD